MSILVDKNTRLLVQGITGNEGTFHTRAMLAYGTNVVAGMTPGRGGQMAVDGRVPVFNTGKQAVQETGANASWIAVPAVQNATDSILEAIDAGLPLIVSLAEGIPANDMISTFEIVRQHGVRLIGPNCPGLLTPGEAKVGIIPGHVARPGNVGLVARSGTLTYEVINALTLRGMGQSTCVGIGGDPVKGLDFIDVLRLFNEDPLT